MRFLNYAVYEVSCESYLVRDILRKYIKVKIDHLGVTDTNQNINNLWYKIIGGPYESVMGGHIFDPVLL